MRSSADKLVLFWLCSAAILSIARALNAADLGYELPTQIQAAQHFLAGKGLTIYSLAGEDDLAAPAKLSRLPYFPVGYSIYASALIGLGLSLGTIVKLLGAVATIVGWWGWARLSTAFFGDVMDRSRAGRWAVYSIALVSPLLSTPAWQETQLFVWAIIPWAIESLAKGSAEDSPRARRFDFLLGVLCGLSFLMRLGGIFLIIYAAFTVVWQSGARVKILAARYGSFAAGVLPLVAVQVLLTHSKAAPAPGIFNIDNGLAGICKRFWEGLFVLPAANFAVVWWAPRPLLNLLTETGKHSVVLFFLTLIGWGLLPVLVVRQLQRPGLTASRDVTVLGAVLFVALPLFLLVWTSIGDYLYVLDQRYYLPLVPMFLFIACASAAPVDRDSAGQKWLSKASAGYVAAYVLIAMISVLLLPLPGGAGSARRTKLFGTQQFEHFPSNKVSYGFSAARQYVVRLVREKPGTVLVTNEEEWFYADPDLDQARIRRLKELRATHVTGPAHIVVAVHDYCGGPVESLCWYGHYGAILKGDYFSNLPGLHLLEEFPAENIKVLEASVPEGSTIPLNKQAVEVKL